MKKWLGGYVTSWRLDYLSRIWMPWPPKTFHGLFDAQVVGDAELSRLTSEFVVLIDDISHLSDADSARPIQRDSTPSRGHHRATRPYGWRHVQRND